jgi:hypothetical protein
MNIYTITNMILLKKKNMTTVEEVMLLDII